MAENSIPAGYKYLIVVALILSVLALLVGFFGFKASGRMQEGVVSQLSPRIEALQQAQGSYAAKSDLQRLEERVKTLEEGGGSK